MALAGVEHAKPAVTAARAAFPQWAATSAARSGGSLDQGGHDHAAAADSSWPHGRFTNAASPGPRRTRDVAEAIDFCEFYAREMIRLAVAAASGCIW